MTARVTTLKGLGIAAYYLGKLGRYYSAPGEPPGQWQGRGAALSGLEGEVEQAEFENVLAGFDPAGVVVRGTRFGDTHARAFDVPSRRRSRRRCSGRWARRRSRRR